MTNRVSDCGNGSGIFIDVNIKFVLGLALN